ncbi:MAG TPA: hypothetical protein VF733_04170 [Candidatus Saccharimonadales bacterium]
MPEPFKQSLIDLLEPMFYADAQNGNSLNIYLSSIGDELFQFVEDWASDTDAGQPGYSLLVDITRSPDIGLPWLAQFVGAIVTSGATPAVQRQQVQSLSAWGRGTVAALQAAPLPWLTGTQTVVIKERDTSPYHLEVYTLASETTNATAVQNALLAQKPAGLQMTYINYAGQAAWTVRGSTMRGLDAVRFAL